MKKIIGIALVGVMALSVFTGMASADDNNSAVASKALSTSSAMEMKDGYETCVIDMKDGYEACVMTDYTFDMFKQELSDDISSEDLAKAEKLFNEAMALEKEEKYEEAMKVWDELYEMNIFDNICYDMEATTLAKPVELIK